MGKKEDEWPGSPTDFRHYTRGTERRFAKVHEAKNPSSPMVVLEEPPEDGVPIDQVLMTLGIARSPKEAEMLLIEIKKSHPLILWIKDFWLRLVGRNTAP